MSAQSLDVEGVLVWRSTTVPTRLAQASLIGALAYIATGNWLAFMWFAGVLLTILTDAELCRRNLRRLQEIGFDVATGFALALSSSVYAAIGLVLLGNPSPIGVAEAALVLCAVMLNAAMMSRGARHVTWILAGPASLCLVFLPVIAQVFGRRIALHDTAPLMIGAVSYIV